MLHSGQSAMKNEHIKQNQCIVTLWGVNLPCSYLWYRRLHVNTGMCLIFVHVCLSYSRSQCQHKLRPVCSCGSNVNTALLQMHALQVYIEQECAIEADTHIHAHPHTHTHTHTHTHLQPCCIQGLERKRNRFRCNWVTHSFLMSVIVTHGTNFRDQR